MAEKEQVTKEQFDQCFLDYMQKLSKMAEALPEEVSIKYTNFIDQTVGRFERVTEQPVESPVKIAHVKGHHVHGYDVKEHDEMINRNLHEDEQTGKFILGLQDQINQSNEENSELKQKNADLETELTEKDQTIAEQDQIITEKDQTIAEKDQIITEKDQTIAEKDQTITEKDQNIKELKEENADLQNQNSSDTSNWPSGMQRYPNTPTYQNDKTDAHDTDKPKRPIGGVPGHEGRTGRLIDGAQIDNVVECYPEGFTQEQIDAYDWTPAARHQVINMITIPVVTEYVQMQARIEGKKGVKMIVGNFPPQAWAEVSYGPSIVRRVLIDSAIGLISMKRISMILRDELGITISVSTVNGLLRRAAEKIFEASAKIARELNILGHKKSAVFNLDETGLSVDGKKYWDHIVVSKNYVHHSIAKSRGLAGMYKSGILQGFAGTAVTDFWKNYVDRGFDNAFCWAHLERDLAAAANRDSNLKWIPMMQTFARESYRAYRQAKEKDTIIPEDKLTDLLDLYDQAVETGKTELDDMSKKSKALLRRFEEHKTGIVAHLVEIYLPRTNNDGERPVRMFKKKLDISGCFKSVRGAEIFAALRTIFDTANKQGINPFEALDQVLGGNTSFLVSHDYDPSLSVTSKPIMTTEPKVDKNAE